MTAIGTTGDGASASQLVGNSKQQQQQQQQGKKRKRKKQRLDPSTSRVVVVGAGLAGLSVAVSLKRAGFSNIDVYERDPSLSHQKEGYGLTLTYNPKGPLANLGVLETVASMDCPSRSHYLFQQQDNEKEEAPSATGDSNTMSKNIAVPIGYFGNAFFGEQQQQLFRRGYGQRGNLRVPRKVLRKILHDTLLEKDEPQQQQPATNNKDANEPVSASPTVHWSSSLVDFEWVSSLQQYRVRFAPSEKNDDLTMPETTTVMADLLVAADGIRSAVLQQLYNANNRRQEKENEAEAAEHEETVSASDSKRSSVVPPSIREFPERYGLRPMGIRLILGIADGIGHPLLRERGFYTVDTHGRRLFTMPYRSNRFDLCDDNENNNNETAQNRIMWQLSFSTPSNPQTLDSASLRSFVLDTFQHWHPPVLDLVESTPPDGIWGTDLMDRDPRQVYQDLIVGKSNGGSIKQPRLVVCGDALHSMSPFKGQGANQALADGPLLAKWLTMSSIDAALTNWWRETLNRTVPVVEASRKAAKDWHDPHRILDTSTESHKEYHGFAGVKPSALSSLIDILKERKIGPHLGHSLDQTIKEVISEHGWFDDSDAKITQPTTVQQSPLDHDLCEKVLKLSAIGDTEGLRKMSLPSSSGGDSLHRTSCLAMVEARDSCGRSCLHLAALGNHVYTCKWLLTELRILEQWEIVLASGTTCGDCDPRDQLGLTALDCALETGNKPLIRLFEVVMGELRRNREAE